MPVSEPNLKVEQKQLPGYELPWQDWLTKCFPDVCSAPFADRHERLWEWFETLGKEPVRARVEVWPRGGAKSTSGELGVVRCCVNLSRRFVLYVSGTQEKQANPHVQNIAAWMSQIGVERALNNYGNSRGWTVNLLRTANGFNVAALGLDAAARGVKLDQYRPDLIIFDDIDSHEDTLETVDKKIRTITTSILPTGSTDCAVLFLQNKIHKAGIVAQLCDNRADFLHDREPAFQQVAVVGLQTQSVEQEDGSRRYAITSGEATWAGQNIETCERQINTWGLKAFRSEAQHEVDQADGIFFRTSMFQIVEPGDVPELTNVCLAGDLAATEGGGNHTVLTLTGTDGLRFYILMMLRGQWSSERVREVINLARAYYKPKFKRFTLHLPQDGGQAGKDQAQQFIQKYPGAKVEIVTGSKATRATSFAEAVNVGNYSLVNQDVPVEFAAFVENRQAWRWRFELTDELSNFREDVKDQSDDIVDSASDGHTELASTRGGYDSF